MSIDFCMIAGFFVTAFFHSMINGDIFIFRGLSSVYLCSLQKHYFKRPRLQFALLHSCWRRFNEEVACLVGCVYSEWGLVEHVCSGLMRMMTQGFLNSTLPGSVFKKERKKEKKKQKQPESRADQIANSLHALNATDSSFVCMCVCVLVSLSLHTK